MRYKEAVFWMDIVHCGALPHCEAWSVSSDDVFLLNNYWCWHFCWSPSFFFLVRRAYWLKADVRIISEAHPWVFSNVSPLKCGCIVILDSFMQYLCVSSVCDLRRTSSPTWPALLLKQKCYSIYQSRLSSAIHLRSVIQHWTFTVLSHYGLTRPYVLGPFPSLPICRTSWFTTEAEALTNWENAGGIIWKFRSGLCRQQVL